MIFLFFFSSRRRHTRWTGDWSSDVCSSDLHADDVARVHAGDEAPHELGLFLEEHGTRLKPPDDEPAQHDGGGGRSRDRSEERRVGKECRCRGSPYEAKKKKGGVGCE